MMNIPIKDQGLNNNGLKKRGSPVKDQDFIYFFFDLQDTRGNSTIIEETKPHVLVGLRMVARRPNDCKGVLNRASSNLFAGFYDPATAQFSSRRRLRMDVER